VSKSGGTVTFSTTAVASDGGSGNITFSSNEGIYITGSYGNAMQGLQQACATSGTFEGIDKARRAVAGRQRHRVRRPVRRVLDNAVYQAPRQRRPLRLRDRASEGDRPVQAVEAVAGQVHPEESP
jgi:hypothetical protein